MTERNKPPCIPSSKYGDTRGLSEKQRWALGVAYFYQERHGGAPAPLTELSEVFFDYDKYDGSAAQRRQWHFQTRRLIQALIRRGLIAAAGTTVSKTGGDTLTNAGIYCPKGYTRVVKTYRLTDAGRIIGAAEHKAVMAAVRATEAANPELKEALKEAAESVQAALAGLGLKSR